MNTMSQTAKRIYNALAFANVNNLGEFRTLLRQIDDPAVPADGPIPHGALSPASSVATDAHAIGHIQGAL